MIADTHDLIRAEVCRKGVEAVTNEMAVTLMRTSGSPVVTEGKDFSTALMDATGEQIGFSTYVIFHVSTSVLAVEAILKHHDIGDIAPGDGFLVNDAHTAGSIHQGDCAIVMPYFHDGKLVAWGHVNEHVLDIGGSAVSGFAPGARDVFSEGLRFDGVRVVRDGTILPEWEQFISTNVRVPIPVLNDLRSMVAAHNTGQARLSHVLEEYGYEEFRRYCEVNKDLTEEMIRSKLEQLPDGRYFSQDWVEFDGHGRSNLYEIQLEMEVHGSGATFRFTGDPQVDAFINATKGVIYGQTMTTLLVQLIPDVPVNAGIWRPFEFDMGPLGTIVNSVSPAPTSQGHMETGMRINKLVCDVVSQAASLADGDLRSRMAGQPANGAVSVCLSGQDRRTGAPLIFYPMSIPHCLGGGAQTVGDGLDTYGSQCVLGNGVPAVEIEESTAPMFVLWRRIAANSGGAGAFSGGRGASMAIAVRGADSLSGIGFNSVAYMPPRGYAGGLPGGASERLLMRDSNLLELLEHGEMPTSDNLEGKLETMPAKVGSMTVREGDVFLFASAGGGGLGDPLLRDPALVAKDVRCGYITAEFGKAVHGTVLLEDGEVDWDATSRCRSEIRDGRLDGGPVADLANADGSSPALQLTDGRWSCARCGHFLGTSEDGFREASIFHEDNLHAYYQRYGIHLRRRPDDQPQSVLREYFCPNCASTLAADVSLEERPDFQSPLLTS